GLKSGNVGNVEVITDEAHPEWQGWRVHKNDKYIKRVNSSRNKDGADGLMLENYVDYWLDANGHNWRALAQLPTDKADGRNYRKCSVCGLEELVSIIPRLNTQPEKQYVLPDANKIYSVNEVMKLLDDYPEGCPGNDNGSHLWRGRIT
ncbi:MAG: hypothetical protein OSJ64_04225, partial [Firmicutes bacterium]|nr:hypothetical protein [Bacillota bacterium]